MNRRKILALLASLLAALAIASSTVATASATTAVPARQATATGAKLPGRAMSLVKTMHSVSPDQLNADGYYICASEGNGPCLNNWNGGGTGNLIRWYQFSENTNPDQQWNWWYEGTVDENQPWPFTDGTGLNSYYNDKPVFKFAYAPNGNGSGNCMSQQLFTPGDTGSNVNIDSCACSTCQTDTGSKFQYFVLDGSGRLVAVEATNLYVASYGTGSRVWIGVGPDGSDANGAYVYLVSNRSYAKTQFAASFLPRQ